MFCVSKMCYPNNKHFNNHQEYKPLQYIFTNNEGLKKSQGDAWMLLVINP